MKAITPHEQIAENSRKEIERIVKLFSDYSNEHKYLFCDILTFAMAKGGYIKYNYIPNDNETLFQFSQLCINYMRKYAIRPDRFIQIVLNTYDYCKIHGYSIDITQTTLKENY